MNEEIKKIIDMDFNPKRQHLWILEFEGLLEPYHVKCCELPIKIISKNVFGKYKVKYTPLIVTLYEPIDCGVSYYKKLSKEINFLKDIKIKLLDPKAKIVETFTYKNCSIQSIQQNVLDYSNDGLLNTTVIFNIENILID